MALQNSEPAAHFSPQTGAWSRLWARLTFSDIAPLIRLFAKQPAELSDLQKTDFVQAALAKPASYLPLEKALPRLRKGVLGFLVRAEKRSFWTMFFIHILDVHF